MFVPSFFLTQQKGKQYLGSNRPVDSIEEPLNCSTLIDLSTLKNLHAEGHYGVTIIRQIVEGHGYQATKGLLRQVFRNC